MGVQDESSKGGSEPSSAPDLAVDPAPYGDVPPEGKQGVEAISAEPKRKPMKRKKKPRSAAPSPPSPPPPEAPRPAPSAGPVALISVVTLTMMLGVAIWRLVPHGADDGELCSNGDECSSGLCVIGELGVGSCAQPCESDADCSEGHVCQSMPGGRACGMAPTQALGEMCADSSECREGQCIGTTTGAGHCARECEEGLCADGLVCNDGYCMRPEWLAPDPEW